MNEIQKNVNEVFLDNFGRTPLTERLNDIFSEAIELHRFTDLANLKEEAGDLLSTTLQLCTECGWDAETIVKDTLTKINKRKLQYKSLGRKINVCILGGAFDPPTIGHIKLAQFILDSSKTFDEIWLMPCFSHMHNKKMESAEHRLAMCKLATKHDGRIQVSPYEIETELSGETYNLIKRLQDQNYAKDRYNFSVAIGLDNANTFDKWVNYELLEKMVRFVVVPRKGVNRDTKVDWYLKPPHIYLSPENDIPDISSTLIREHFDMLDGADEDYEIEDFIIDNLPNGVYHYIVENNLYGR